MFTRRGEALTGLLAALAEIGYPAGDESLLPMRNQILDVWLSERFYKEFDSTRTVPKSRGAEGVPRIQGRYRRCGSQQGNALYSMTRLGLTDRRTDQLVERLLHWQWPDGGWNRDRNPSADTSSFMETLLPMLGVAPYNREAALRAAEVFLLRRLFRRRTDGRVISPNFLMHHYPRDWHYDLLGGVVAMAEMDLIGDQRCSEALNRLEQKELPRGGWAAEGKFYRVHPSIDTTEKFGATSPVGWGGVGRARMNEWVSADALYVLRAAGRL